MITETLSVLIIDIASTEKQPLLDALDKQGFHCEVAASPEEATVRLGEASFDAVIIYERAAANRLEDFVDSARRKHPRLAVIVVQTAYDGRQECRLFDLGVDDIVTLDYSPPLVATRAALRTRNLRETMSP